MFRRISDFQAAWAHERESTLAVLRALTDAALAQAVTKEGRTLGRLAWHVATTPGEMMERTSLVVGGPPHDSPVPATASAIVEAYDVASASLLGAIAKGWKDETLDVEDDMYGQRWSRGQTLQALIVHQAHHRGQMTVLMRQAGLRVPGVYGPAREDWAAMGMPTPEV